MRIQGTSDAGLVARIPRRPPPPPPPRAGQGAGQAAGTDRHRLGLLGRLPPQQHMQALRHLGLSDEVASRVLALLAARAPAGQAPPPAAGAGQPPTGARLEGFRRTLAALGDDASRIAQQLQDWARTGQLRPPGMGGPGGQDLLRRLSGLVGESEPPPPPQRVPTGLLVNLEG